MCLVSTSLQYSIELRNFFCRYSFDIPFTYISASKSEYFHNILLPLQASQRAVFLHLALLRLDLPAEIQPPPAAGRLPPRPQPQPSGGTLQVPGGLLVQGGPRQEERQQPGTDQDQTIGGTLVELAEKSSVNQLRR